MWIIISDTHIGDIHADHSLEKLFSFLYSLPTTINLVLNGDIIDIAKHSTFDDRHTKFFSILQRFKKVIYLQGNHDWKLSKLPTLSNISYQNELIIKKDKIILIKHGHVPTLFDASIRFFIRTNKWIYKIFKINFQHVFGKLLSKSMLKRQEKYITSKANADILITGHTHAPKIQKLHNKIYINTGDWVNEKHRYYAIIDDNGNASLNYIY